MRVSIDLADAFVDAYAERLSAEVSKAKAAKHSCVDFHEANLRTAALKDAEEAVAAQAAKAAAKSNGKKSEKDSTQSDSTAGGAS